MKTDGALTLTLSQGAPRGEGTGTNRSNAMAGRLTSDEVNYFKNEGYLLYKKPVFPQAKFDGLKAHFEQKLSTWDKDSGGKSPEGMDTPHFTDVKLFQWLF